MATVMLVTVAFLLYPAYLPMADLPQHAVQVAVLDDLLKGRSPWSDMLVLHWDTPYWTTYSVWLLLHQFIGMAWSPKIVVILILLFYMASVRLVRRAFRASRLTDWVALTCFFGFAFQWGFVSFLAGIPVGMLFLAANKFWLDTQKPKYLWMIAFLGIWSYYSHVLTFAFFCFISYGMFLVDFRRLSWKQRGMLTLPYLLFAGMLLRYLTKPNPEPFMYYPEGRWENPGIFQKTSELLFYPWNMGQLFYYDFACAALLLAPPLLGYRPSRDVKRYALLLGSLAIWYALPHIGFQTAYIYQRFGLFVPVFWYLVWQPQEAAGRRYDMKQVAVTAFVCAVAALMFKVYSNNVLFDSSETVKDFDEVVATMPSEKRILGLGEPFMWGDGKLTSFAEYLHFAQWYQVKKRGWADYSFASAHAMPVRLKLKKMYPGYGYNRLVDEKNLTEILDCSIYSYLLVRTQKTPGELQRLLDRNPRCNSVRLNKQAGQWLLFENPAVQ
ncbi:hypothetical protein [Neisseria chenwenguii]|nr:hypothetical protein [Neisseria chenwenguii]